MPVTITDNYGTAVSLAMPDEQEPIALAIAGGSTLTITPGLPSGVVSVRFAMLASASVRAIVSGLAAASGAVVASAAVRARISAIAAAGAAVIGAASVSAQGSATGRLSAAVTGGASIVARGRVMTAPSAFTSGDWSVATDASTVTISTLPADGGSAITDIEYRVNSGSAVSLGETTTGTYAITASGGDDIEIRAVNSVGAGAWSDTKTIFTPASLFASGEQGAWYEPSPSTCFTDTAGTTPATYGDPVARVNDESGNDNHATQATAAARPILARVPEGGRRNLLERTEEFDNAAWGNDNASSVPSAETPPSGLSGIVYKLTEDNAASAPHTALQKNNSNLVTSDTWTFSLYIKDAGDGRFVQLRPFGLGAGVVYATFDPTDGSLTESGGTELVGTPTSTSVGNGWYRIEVTSSADILDTNDGVYIVLASSGTSGEFPSYSGDGASGVYIFGAQFEIGTSVTAYQKVVSEYDITEDGVTSIDYLFDDQSDDALNWTAPADTDYTISYVDTAGNVTKLTGQSLSGDTDILLDPALVAYLAIDRALTAGETTDLETYWGTLA